MTRCFESRPTRAHAVQDAELAQVGRFVYQRGRFISALVRPLVWLFIFAAFRVVRNAVPLKDPVSGTRGADLLVSPLGRSERTIAA